MEKEILLVNDLCGVGKVALSVMIPLLSAQGHIVHNLPTALVSNTLDYGVFDIQDTTKFMENTLNAWDQLNFQFDCICTGFLVSEKQVELLKRLFARHPEALKIVDPILGDEGHLYPGVDPSAVELRRELAASAQVIVPNLTEAALLCSHPDWGISVTRKQKDQLLDELTALGCSSVVITSVVFAEEGGHYVCGRDEQGVSFNLPFEMIDVRIPGTGDVFSAVLAGALLQQKPLPEACQKAMDAVEALIRQNQYNSDLYRGLRIEQAIAENRGIL
ncbi:PfkB family carbohydrate kinase [Holdemania sp. Marseille-P2844]|uniref:PfkB family carbohydrate kinase n=1 Tax=Holdemania sp. Marseille-P2844 TaxID=1852366 RepID=UPI0009344709|nr:PfkB family carbohydrate kinase [Holdemania sp. Marseille-P2844]